MTIQAVSRSVHYTEPQRVSTFHTGDYTLVVQDGSAILTGPDELEQDFDFAELEPIAALFIAAVREKAVLDTASRAFDDIVRDPEEQKSREDHPAGKGRTVSVPDWIEEKLGFHLFPWQYPVVSTVPRFTLVN